MMNSEDQPHQGRIDCIEILRAFAVLFVVIHHTKGGLVKITAPNLLRFYEYFCGWVGVDLFFAISGFVITRSLLFQIPERKDQQAFWRIAICFWIRRAWRLLPSCWLWLAIILGCAVFYNDSGIFGSFRTNFAATLAAVFNVANFRFADAFGNYFYGASFVYWSLSLEEQFYLFLPFSIFLFRRRLPYLLGLAVVVQLVSQRSLLLMACRTDAILLGVLLAMWSQTKIYRLFEPKRLRKSPLIALTVLGVLLMGLVCMPSDSLKIVPLPVGMVALISIVLVWLASYDGQYILPVAPLRKVFCWVGSRSYGIYLIHIPAFYAVRETLHRLGGAKLPDSLWVVGPALAAVFFLSDLNYRFIEKPMRRKGAEMAEQIKHETASEISAAARPLADQAGETLTTLRMFQKDCE